MVKCPKCDGPMEVIHFEDLLPNQELQYSQYTELYICPECGRIEWREKKRG